MKKTQLLFEQVSAKILTELKALADERTNEDVRDVVITVPANFNTKQKSATMNAAKIANLNVMRMINDPTAAAIAGKFDQTAEESDTILVFDLGGGTFDVTLLCVSESVYDVLATCGDMRLGGRDFDQVLFEIIRERVKAEMKTREGKVETKGHDPLMLVNTKNRLQKECEKVKKDLTANLEAQVILPDFIKDHEIYEDLSIDLTITRAEFEERSMHIFDKIRGPLEECLATADM